MVKYPVMEGKNNFFSDTLESIISSLIVVIVIYLGIAFPEVVYGASMEPSLYTGERILVERISSYFDLFKRGDVVVIHPPENDNIDYVKRIIGVPGDIMKIFECKVFISRSDEKFALEEPYITKGTCTIGGSALKDGRYFRIEKGYYAVLGDNRSNSADSRSFGLVEKERIIGKVAIRFWPLEKIKVF